MIFTQDPPQDFEFNQSTAQSFYSFSTFEILGVGIEDDDWIGAFNVYDETLNGTCTQEFINYDETLNGTCLSIGECMPGVDGCIDGLGPDATCQENLDIDGDGLLSFCACPDVDNDGLILTQNIEIAVGARMIADCAGSSQCDIPVFGFDGECYSAGYLKDGQIPFFKIYDSSADSYYYAFIEGDIIDAWTGLPDEDLGAFELNGYLIADSLTVTFDCNNDLGGTAFLDNCNVCSGGNTAHLADSDIDCHGDCFGTAFIDGCGDCVEGNTGLEECQNDCNGDLGGTAFYDDCLVCSEGNTGNIANSIELCLQDALLGNFNQSLYPDLDCNCDCFGSAIIDDCGVCTGGLSGNAFNANLDCSGVCFGTAEIESYCLDFDGDGLGLPSSNIDLCNTDIVEDCSGEDCYVSDCTDLDDNCDANLFEIDCAGICDGPNEINLYCLDEDLDGLGNPSTELEECSANIDEGYVLDCSDVDDSISCPSNLIDECNDCIWIVGDDQLVCSQGDLIFDLLECPSGWTEPNQACQEPTAYDQSISLDEDSSIFIELSAFDPLGQDLIFVIDEEFAPENGNLELFSNNVYKYTPNENYNGSDFFRFYVISQDWVSESASIFIDVLPVNDAPELSLIENIVLNEGESVFITLSGSDLDNTELEFSISGGSEETVFAEISDSQVTFYAYGDFNGSIEFNALVSDSDLTDSQTFTVTALPVNDLPEFTQSNIEFVINEDAIFEFDFSSYVIDVENDNLSIIFDSANESCEDSNGEILYGALEINNLQLTYSPFANIFINENECLENISFKVFDGTDLSEGIFTLSINILPINDSPTIQDIENQIIDEDTFLDIEILVTDIDNTNLNISVSEIDNGTVSIENNFLYLYPESNFNGVIPNIEVIVSDGELSGSTSFNVTVNPVNDAPVLTQIESQSIDEGGVLELTLSATDIDADDTLSYEVTSSSSSEVEVDGDQLTITPQENYNGSFDVTVLVSDQGGLSDSQIFTLNVNPVNDRPMARRIIESIGEDCSLDIDVNTNTNLCIEEILDGVKCDCNSDLFLSGVCDIESSNLTYQVITQPENGEVIFNGSIATYSPDLDYISEDGSPDVFRYKVCDDELCSFDDDSEILSDGICINDNQCPFVEVTVGKLNDTPAVNCINDDCNMFLSDYYYLMYEDCLDYDNFAISETENLDDCNSLEGISISKLRTFNLEISNICDESSDSVLWYDTDCENSENQNEFNYGIAVDIQSNLNNNESKGVWKYKLKNENTFNSFGIDIGCNYKLLDQEDEIKFFPNNDYFSVNNEFPSFSFYPWDKTEDVDDEDLCIELLNSRDEPCGGASAYSSQPIELKWEVIAVNDTPRLDAIGDLIEDSSIKEFCDIENDEDCNENQDFNVLINAYDLKDPQDDLYFYISSQTISNNENQSLFKKINFDNNLFINESLVNPDLIFNEEIITNNLLKLDLTNYANGTAKIKVGISDRENIDDGLFVVDSFNVKINPVNNRISSFSIVENISAYDDYENESMFVNIDEQFSIKYPDYQYNEVDLNINDINDTNFSDIRNYMISNPYKMNNIYFKWNRTSENGYYLDFDIDPLLNDEPYELYYRLELLDYENNVYVLKDSIPDSSFPGLEYAYTNIKFSSGPFKTYIDGDIYNSQTDLKAQIDTTGLTQYNWRIIAENYEQGEILENYDFYNTATTLSDNSYLINTHIPTLNFDFVLNDIYNNYFDLYLSPIPSTFNGENNYYNLNFNENSEIYLNYSNDGVSPNEINILSNLTLNDDQDNNLNYQNIYHTYDDFNELGKMTWFAPISNNVGTVNIFAKDVYYESILPNTYNSIDSNSGSFNIQFFTNENINILLQENSRKSIAFNFDLVSDILKINSNKNNINYDIKLSYNIENLTNNDISFAKIIDNEIIPIPSFVENYKLVAYVSEFESYVVIQLDNNNFEDEIPIDINVISCYPNPFNPSTTIRFTLDSSNDFNIKIFNLSGQEVFTKNNLSSNLGLNEYTWNGNDNKGNNLTSGIYFIAIEIGNRILMEKVTLLK